MHDGRDVSLPRHVVHCYNDTKGYMVDCELMVKDGNV